MAEPPKRRTTKPSAKEASASAELLVTIVEALAIALSGVEAQLQESERALITPALARTLARLDDRAAQAIQNLSDPVAILAGFGMYTLRIAELRRLKTMQSPPRRSAASAAGEPTTAPESVASATELPNQNDPSVAPAPPEFAAAMLST